MHCILRGGRVIETSGKLLEPTADTRGVFDSACDVHIRDGRIVEVGKGLRAAGALEIRVDDLLVVPGLVDLHVHFREPGQEYKEDLESGARAAAYGGFTTVCAMPNTKPVNDCRAVTELMVRRSREIGSVRVRPIGAISRGLEGKELAEYAEMQEAGIVAISDDGRPVMNGGFMRRAFEYARTFGLPVVQHAEDLGIAEGGVMNEGEISARIGLKGQPPQAESVMVARDLELVEWTGGQYHVAHLSSARSVELVRQGKARGLPVTCEVTPHHVTLTDVACSNYDTDCKVMPPLRTQDDIDALKEGLRDGTIDCIATDHAPHSLVEKDVEFACAAPGMLGLETAVPLTLALVREGVITLQHWVALLTSNPARIFSLHREGVGSLAPGLPADIAVIDPSRAWRCERTDVQSKSRNTPFHGMPMVGQAVLTLVGGKCVLDRDNRIPR